MNAEIVAIGTELLLGEIADTNSAVIARALREIGLDLWWISAVGDNEGRIAALVDQSRRRSAVVITTGGLGPTVDDPTRAAIARAFGRELEYRPELWQQIETRFQRYGRTPTENNRKQAYVPAGAIALENPVGTAPCFIVEHDGGAVISLPGVPRELEYMLEHAVVPYLRQKFNLASVIRAKVLRTVGIGESLVDARIGDLEELANPTVGLAAHPGQTDIRITAKAGSLAEADALIAPVEAELRKRLGHHIYGEGRASVEAVVAEMLAERAQALAVVEAGTRGHLSGRLRALPQAEQVFRGGAIEPDTGLSAANLAEAARSLGPVPADWGLGVVVRTGESTELEVAVAGPEGVEASRFGFGGHPDLAVRWAGTSAINLLRLRLLKNTNTAA